MWIKLCVMVCCCMTTISCLEGGDGAEDASQPLLLTPLIQKGHVEEARKAAEVNHTDFGDLKSYSGYFTVSERFNSNLFFLFFPSEHDYENAPLILWLQGGPGLTSLVGAFVLNGPFRVTDDLELERNSASWSLNHSVLYIDNPVGTGYSFTSEGGHAENQTIIAEHLYTALQQFFQVFPELQKNDFFVTGESYAGKYVPSLSYHIMKQNPTAKMKINLKGLAIGNGLCDPENQLEYAEYLYQIGLIDSKMKKVVQEKVDEIVGYIRQQKWIDGFFAIKNLLIDTTSKTNIFRNFTGFINYQNYLSVNDATLDNFLLYAVLPRVKTALHVGNTKFNYGLDVLLALKHDILQSIAPLLTALLDHYRVLFYVGQLDIITAYPLMENFLQKLKFDGSEEYEDAQRHIWYHDGDIAGYVKHAGRLTEMLVRNAGHMVPLDQPTWALEMITKFTRNQSFY